MLPDLYGYLISVHHCLCGSSQLLTSYGNQEGSPGAGLLDGRSHKPVDKLLHDDLVGECLGDFDHRRKTELVAQLGAIGRHLADLASDGAGPPFGLSDTFFSTPSHLTLWMVMTVRLYVSSVEPATMDFLA